MKVQKISGPLQTTRYFSGKAFHLIGWYEDETEAQSIAKKLLVRNIVRIVLNDQYYGVYARSTW